MGSAEEKEVTTEGEKELEDSIDFDMIGDLPYELSQQILGLLHFSDLVSCTEVNKAWRCAVNSDSIWKAKCKMYNWGLEILDLPELNFWTKNGELGLSSECPTLGPLCEWRKAFNVHHRLQLNWKENRSAKFGLSSTQSPVFCLHCDGGTVATGHQDGSFALWDVNSIPCMMCESRALLSDCPVLTVRTAGRHIACVQKKLLQVYRRYPAGEMGRIGSKASKLILVDALSFEIGRSEKVQVADKIRLLGPQFEPWYTECLRWNDFYTPRKLLVAATEDLLYANMSGSCELHIWSLEVDEHGGPLDGLKRHRLFPVCLPGEEVRDLNLGDPHDHAVYLTVSGDTLSVVMYDSKTWSARRLVSAPGTRKILVSGDFLIGLPATGVKHLARIRVWKRNGNSTSQGNLPLLAAMQVTGAHVTAAVVQETGYVLYSEDSEVTVWDPVEDLVIKRFSTGGSVGFMRPGYSSFVLVFINSSLYLWDWARGVCLYMIYSGLEWTGDYRGLVWVSTARLILGGVNNQPEMIVYI